MIRRDARIEIGEPRIGPGQSFAVDVVPLFSSALKGATEKREIHWSGDPTEDRYVLETVIVEYEPGNAFKRWLAPGYGSTVLRVRGRLLDGRDGTLSGEIDHQRSIHWGGAYTIGAWKTIFRSVADDIARDLEYRIEGKGFVVNLQPWSSRNPEIPRAANPASFKMGLVTDGRVERGSIGERLAAFGVSMGGIYPSRDVAEFLREMMEDELRGAGHCVVGEGNAPEVSANVLEFWVRTDTTPLYWDIVGQISLAVTVGAGDTTAEPHRETYSCREKKRTYVWPSAGVVETVLNTCLEQLMRELRADPVWNEMEMFPAV